MYKKIRKSFAEAIANVDDPDQFEWNKWLKEPQIYLERFPKPRIDVKSVDNYKTFTEPTLYQVKKFTLTKFKVSEEVRQVVIKKKKTIKIFFTFPKPYEQRIKIFDPNTSRILFLQSFLNKNNELFVRTVNDNKESVKNLTTKTTSKKLEPIKIKVKTHQASIKSVNNFKHDCVVNKPELSDHKMSMTLAYSPDKIYNLSVLRPNSKKKYLAIAFNKIEKKPSVKNIPVITLDEIKDQLQKSESKKILTFRVDKIDQKPKHYNVKLVQLEKMQVPLFHLKNLHAKEAKLKTFNFNALEKAAVNESNLIKEHPHKLKITNPGILNQLIPVEMVEPKKIVTKTKITAETKSPSVDLKVKKIVKSKVDVEEKKINLKEIEYNFKSLFPYQKEGIELLLSHKTALISDEMGIDKKVQAILALQAAIKQRVIKNALIVCPNSQIGSKNVAEHLTNSEGWESQIHKLAPELRFVTINAIDDERSIAACRNAEIFITDYKTLIELSNDSTKETFKKNVECLILDEAQYLINNEVQSEHLFNFPSSKYRWILSSLPSQLIEERLIPKLRNHLVGFNQLEGLLNRTKHTLGSKLPPLVRNDYWHELDVDQKQEFENTILQGRKRILDLVKGGNPFIIQSNIFTLIHQIKQLGNFSTHKEMSPKSDLLLDQLDSIITSGQKSIVFSQYDKQGIQKIERLLKNNQIRYVVYQSGMALKELENSTNTFKKESRISVMLAGLTAASVKVKIPEASYLIHFDQWWNPITQWQYEDRALNIDNLNQSTESVNVINYFGNNSVELNIRETLQNKGLLTKNLIEFISNETLYGLISNEDWLDILGIEHTRSYKNRKPDIEAVTKSLSECPFEEIGHKAKDLFTKLGYKNLLVKPDMLHEELAIYGMANKGLHEIKTAILCLPFKTKDVEPVETFTKEALKNNIRIFVICSDEILQQVTPDPQERIIYIGQQMFANYISEFKIN
jgi:SNF2 family DNA or RNA helicase